MEAIPVRGREGERRGLAERDFLRGGAACAEAAREEEPLAESLSRDCKFPQSPPLCAGVWFEVELE